MAVRMVIVSVYTVHIHCVAAAYKFSYLNYKYYPKEIVLFRFLYILLRSENLQTIREYKSLKKPEFSQMQQRNQTRSL